MCLMLMYDAGCKWLYSRQTSADWEVETFTYFYSSKRCESVSFVTLLDVTLLLNEIGGKWHGKLSQRCFGVRLSNLPAKHLFPFRAADMRRFKTGISFHPLRPSSVTVKSPNIVFVFYIFLKRLYLYFTVFAVCMGSLIRIITAPLFLCALLVIVSFIF